jgi:hypothetical protein
MVTYIPMGRTIVTYIEQTIIVSRPTIVKIFLFPLVIV